MKQSLIWVCGIYYTDLTAKIQDQIDEHNEYNYLLTDIQYFGMETESGSYYAFLLFTRKE